MANITSFQKLVDTNRKAVIKITNRFDGASGQDSGRLVIDSSNLAFALNTTGGLKTGGTNALPRYRVDVVKAYGSVSPGGQVLVQYDNTVAANQQNSIVAIFNQGFSNYDEEGHVMNNPHFGTSNGNIIVTTLGIGANGSYDITLELRKDAMHFGAGQHADPAAFNRHSS